MSHLSIDEVAHFYHVFFWSVISKYIPRCVICQWRKCRILSCTDLINLVLIDFMTFYGYRHCDVSHQTIDEVPHFITYFSDQFNMNVSSGTWENTLKINYMSTWRPSWSHVLPLRTFVTRHWILITWQYFWNFDDPSFTAAKNTCHLTGSHLNSIDQRTLNYFYMA